MALFGIVLVVAIVSPVLLVPTCIIGIFFYFIRIFYVKTSRAIKRLEAVSKFIAEPELSSQIYLRDKIYFGYD